MLTGALHEELSDLDDAGREHLIRLALLLSSPMAWLYWRDYLDLDPGTAADTAVWAIKRTTAR